MNEFLKFFDDKVKHYPMHLEVYYSKTIDWYIHVYKMGRRKNGDDLEILCVQGGDLELVFAKAYVELKEWLLEHEGGY